MGQQSQQTPRERQGPGEEQAAPAVSAACLSKNKSHSTALETPSHLCPSGNLLAVAVARGGMASYLAAQGREERAHEFLASGRHLERRDWGLCWSCLSASVAPQGCCRGAGRAVFPDLLL